MVYSSSRKRWLQMKNGELFMCNSLPWSFWVTKKWWRNPFRGVAGIWTSTVNVWTLLSTDSWEQARDVGVILNVREEPRGYRPDRDVVESHRDSSSTGNFLRVRSVFLVCLLRRQVKTRMVTELRSLSWEFFGIHHLLNEEKRGRPNSSLVCVEDLITRKRSILYSMSHIFMEC